MAILPVSRGRNRKSQGVESRGWGGIARYSAIHANHKAIGCSDRIVSLENSHGRKSLPTATKICLNNSGLFFTKSRVLARTHPRKFTRTSPKTWEDKFLGIPFWRKTKVSSCSLPSTKACAREREMKPLGPDFEFSRIDSKDRSPSSDNLASMRTGYRSKGLMASV